MNNWQELVKIMVAILSATGLWKLIEIWWTARNNKPLKEAETKKVEAETRDKLIENWQEWGQHLEKQIEALQNVVKENAELKRLIVIEQVRVSELETQFKSLKAENEALRAELAKLKSNT